MESPISYALTIDKLSDKLQFIRRNYKTDYMQSKINKIKGESMKKKSTAIFILIASLFLLCILSNPAIAGEIKTVVLNVPNLPSGS